MLALRFLSVRFGLLLLLSPASVFGAVVVWLCRCHRFRCYGFWLLLVLGVDRVRMVFMVLFCCHEVAVVSLASFLFELFVFCVLSFGGGDGDGFCGVNSPGCFSEGCLKLDKGVLTTPVAEQERQLSRKTCVPWR